MAAKAATSTIPIVFAIGGDPVKTWARGELQPAGRVRHWDKHFDQRVGSQAARTFTRAGVEGDNSWLSHKSNFSDCRKSAQRYAGGGARDRCAASCLSG